MLPLSCTNCWYNPLQYGAVGLPVGYCTEHRCVLNRPHETTRGRLLRKDLSLLAAQRENAAHRSRFDDAYVSVLRAPREQNGVTSTEPQDLAELGRDAVGDTVLDYGELSSKIESLAQLRRIPGVRAELAMLSLARGYVNRCVKRDGRWTSGVHLFWWTKVRLAEEPEVLAADITEPVAIRLSRLVEIAKWSIVMLRLTFLADIGVHATNGHPVSNLSSLPDDAAEATGTVGLRKLMSWIRRTALPRVEQGLSYAEYKRLSRELHEEH